MNERIHIIRESVVKLTQLLAGKGILVTQRGISAYVKQDAKGRPVAVNLPYIPDNANSELIDAIQGFLDHEVAHILFTDFDVSREASKKGCHSLWNVIEDARIEREMAKRFQGSSMNLSNTGKFFLDKYITPRVKEAIEEGDTTKLTGALMVPLIRAMSGQQMFKEYMRDKMELIADTYDKIKKFERNLASIESSKDALAVAQEMIKALSGDEPAKKQPKQKQPPKSNTPPSAPKDSEEPESDPSSGGDTDDESEDKDGAEGEGEGAGSTESEEKPEDEGGSAGSAGASDKSEGKGKGEGEGEEESEESGSSVVSGKAEKSKSEVDLSVDASGTWEEIEKELASADFDETLMREITNATTEVAKDADYLIFSKDNDVVEPLHVGSGYKSNMLSSLEDKVMHLVGPLQKDLERAISARTLSQYSAGHRSGRLHAANLARLALNDSRVFRRKHEATSKDVAVSLLVDMSGSMDGAKITLATQAAYALAQVLERIGIASEVLCFTTGTIQSDSEMEKQMRTTGAVFSRMESLYMPILKTFNERLTVDVRTRFGWLPHVANKRNNVDGESVEIAALRLLKRREKGKILMVLSDGAPAASGSRAALEWHLKKVVNDVAKAGVNVVGIGINSTEVRKFYPKHLVLREVSELPSVVMKELRSLLIS